MVEDIRYLVDLHGVGASVVNAFQNGVKLKLKEMVRYGNKNLKEEKLLADLEIIGETDEHGTKVFFKPDQKFLKKLNLILKY